MNVNTILDHIDNGHMALPEFQRGYVWSREQVRGLMQSLYRGYPAGGLLVWATKSEAPSMQARGDGPLASGVVKLLLDGQQRITSLYGIIRGKPPAFFDGNAQAFTGLYFNVTSETFEFYSPKKMATDPAWIDVTALMKAGNAGVGEIMKRLEHAPELKSSMWDYMPRVNALLSIRERDFPIQEVTDSVAGTDENVLDVVVDIFNRVNSGGTKLSKGDLALARICAEAPDARDTLKKALRRWGDAGFKFGLDWLLRSVNTVGTGEARFSHLHHVSASEFRDALARAERSIDWLLNAIDGRLGLDHDRVFFGRFAVPVMARYVDQRGGRLVEQVEIDRMLFWYVQAAMWGRFSANLEGTLDRDLALIEEREGALERLIDEVRLAHGGLRVQPGHFGGQTIGARFYPVLYLLTRQCEARDWGSGMPLKSGLHGRMNKLEVHHIFPKARLKKSGLGYEQPEINAIANFCFLTKDTNLQISDRSPEVYFPEIESRHPGALASQWIPMDENLWKLPNYRDFLEARRALLTKATNTFLEELFHGPIEDDISRSPANVAAEVEAGGKIPGGIESEEEAEALESLNAWVVSEGLPEGSLSYELVDTEGYPVAILDLAWPEGLQPGLTEPVAVLLDEGDETVAAARKHGFKTFESVAEFEAHVRRDILAMGDAAE